MPKEEPTWPAGVTKPSFPKLSKNLTTDVVVVGGGLAGIMAAYFLVKAGKKVVVLEQGQIGNGATSYTTAFITQDIDTQYSELISLFGPKKAKLIWQSGGEAIDAIAQIIKDEKIDCEFERVSVFMYGNDSEEYKSLMKEQEAQTKHGLKVGIANRDSNLNFPNSGYYEIPNQAKFHPLKFLYALVQVAKDAGVQIYENSEVKQIDHQEIAVQVGTDKHKVECQDVVIATYQPFHNRLRLFLQRAMYKSFVFELKIPHNLIPEGLYIDNDNPYHYFRIDKQSEHCRMIIGGEDIKIVVKMDDAKNFMALEEYVQKILPTQKYEIIRQWAGQVLEPSDGLALIGEVAEHEYVATAFSGNGMTYSAIAALIIRDSILGKENKYAEVYDPKRIPSLKTLLVKGGDYVEEFMGGAAKNIFKKPKA